MQLIDSHCHFDMVLDKGLTIEMLCESMNQASVSNFIQIAADKKALAFCDAINSGNHEHESKIGKLYYTVGMHPGDAGSEDPAIHLAEIEKRVADPLFVSVGEIGLDYFYGAESKELQKDIFYQYLEAAVTANKPVCIHTRDAHEDTLEILSEFATKLPGILIHCFTGNAQQMKDYLKLGCYISFSGIVTFKSAQELQQAALECPSEKMLIETDAPYLAPIPYRGKVNHPGYLLKTLEFIAHLRNDDIEKLGQQTRENTIKFYQL